MLYSTVMKQNKNSSTRKYSDAEQAFIKAYSSTPTLVGTTALAYSTLVFSALLLAILTVFIFFELQSSSSTELQFIVFAPLYYIHYLLSVINIVLLFRVKRKYKTKLSDKKLKLYSTSFFVSMIYVTLSTIISISSSLYLFLFT